MPSPKLRLRRDAGVDPEDGDRLEVQCSRADAHAEPGPVEDQKQSDHRRHHQSHHEHAVAGQKKEGAAERAGQPAGDRERQGGRAPDVARAILQDEGQAKGEQQTVQRITAVERADQDALDDEAEGRRQHRRDRQCAPEADMRDQHVGEIPADRQKPAMREVDHAGKVEDQRQAERHQCVERANDQPVEQVEEQQLRHCARSAVSASLPSPPVCGGRGRGPVALAMGRVRWALQFGTPPPPTSPRPSPPPGAERELNRGK